MPWYNSDRIEPGKLGNPYLLAREEELNPFRDTTRLMHFRFAPCQPVEPSMHS
jgi:hypothetical protein